MSLPFLTYHSCAVHSRCIRQALTITYTNSAEPPEAKSSATTQGQKTGSFSTRKTRRLPEKFSDYKQRIAGSCCDILLAAFRWPSQKRPAFHQFRSASSEECEFSPMTK